jgi:hypothetical protein
MDLFEISWFGLNGTDLIKISWFWTDWIVISWFWTYCIVFGENKLVLDRQHWVWLKLGFDSINRLND